MDYIRLSSALRSKKMYIFAFADLKNLFPDDMPKTIKNNFTRWLAKGYFVRLKRDLYEFIGYDSGEKIPDLYVANRLYEPSYVSLETALSIYGIIPEVAAGVTAVTTLATRTFKNKYGSFFYRSCEGRAFTGYRLMRYEGFKVCIADKEKSLVDFLYYRLRSVNVLDFVQERFNKTILKKLNWRKIFRYAKLFNKKTIETVKKCKEYAKC